jgi:hypothetical protein
MPWKSTDFDYQQEPPTLNITAIRQTMNQITEQINAIAQELNPNTTIYPVYTALIPCVVNNMQGTTLLVYRIGPADSVNALIADEIVSQLHEPNPAIEQVATVPISSLPVSPLPISLPTVSPLPTVSSPTLQTSPILPVSPLPTVSPIV